jgi:UDP-N-acetylmuramoylalanine--D-glutamate ligase
MPQQAAIIGLGRSGIAAAKLLQKQGWQVQLFDSATSPNLLQSQSDLAREGIKVLLGQNLDLNVSPPPDLIVVSPGVPWDIPVLVNAREQGLETIGEMELAWRFLPKCPWVGITGTNGKTTTTALVAAIFQTAGLHAPACGNIGYAACELGFSSPPDWLIAEISSYQIESSSRLAPEIGIWTTFTPDHLSRHKTLTNYYQIKASLLHRCRYQIFNGDDPYLRQVAPQDWSQAYWTSVQGKEALISSPERGVYIEDNWVVAFGELILPLNLWKMIGVHNRQNLLMAIAAARLAGVEKKAIAEAVATFNGVPHRLELILTLDGIQYINDSKATNYDAAEVGLASVAAPVILIAGGEAKEGDDQGWLAQIQDKAAAVLLIGSAAHAFAQRLAVSGYENYEIVTTLEAAITRSYPLAQQKQAKVVLLSPACASFDQYQSFEHRGDHFRSLCRQLQASQ